MVHFENQIKIMSKITRTINLRDKTNRKLVSLSDPEPDSDFDSDTACTQTIALRVETSNHTPRLAA